MNNLLMILVLVLTIIFSIGVVIFIIVRRKNDKMRNELFMTNLDNIGFMTTKRLIVFDLLPPSLRWVANLFSGAGDSIEPWVGVWIDYTSERLAIRTSQLETTPQIFNFSELVDYELLEGQRIVTSGHVIGFGAYARINTQQSEYADSLKIRILLGQESSGINSLTIPLFKINILAGGKSTVSVKSASYIACYNCAVSIIDELGYIKRS